MTRSSTSLFMLKRSFLLNVISVAIVCGLLLCGLMGAPPVNAQSQQADWEKAAGGKMSFEVASVKPNKAGAFPSGPRPYSNIPPGPGDDQPTGNLFSATNTSLWTLISFAYKFTLNESIALDPQLPKWAKDERFDIQARATGSPTKDQFRLMVQSLLADRFKVAMHYEVRQIPLYYLVLAKPGKMGSQLRSYGNEAPCPSVSDPSATVTGGFPSDCGALRFFPSSQPGLVRVGARNVDVGIIATSLSGLGSLDRPVFDRTGLTGNIDFIIEWDRKPATAPMEDATGPNFVQALQDELGLKLDAQKGPVNTFVLDHIEEPSAN
jgi:uncharacterized protein (TIGR03435 family)